jgi:hypothetical protein
MIPKYDVSGPQFDPEDVLDVIPEQEKQEQIIRSSEDAYLNSLERNAADRIKNTEKMWGGLADLSTSIAGVIKQKQDKYKSDREAQISLDILTNGVSPELEAQFRGEKYELFNDDLATQEFASKYESETGDSITANEFRKMAGWERYMVAEQYALQKAKDYDKYVYDAYENTKINVIRDGQPATVGHLDNLSPQEQAALDQKIKFEYARQFAGLNQAMVATVVKPEIDKFDAARRKKQAVAREQAYQMQVQESDERMIRVGFSTANPADGHQLAHDWVARYAARNQTSKSVGRMAFAENLIDLVGKNEITYPEAMSVVNHEIQARDGSIKTMTSWREWDGLASDLSFAAEKGTAAKADQKKADIAADLQVIKSISNPTNDQKQQMAEIYKDKYGYIPNELSGALAGHIDDDQAEHMIQQSIRYQGGVYDFEMANVSTSIFNKYKDKIIQSGAMVPGSAENKEARKLIKAFTNQGTGDAFGETDAKSIEWLMLNENLNTIFDEAYMAATVRNGVVVGTQEAGYKAGMLAVEKTINNKSLTNKLMNTDFESDGDETYERSLQTNIVQSAGGKWKTSRLSSNQAIEKKLLMWSKTPLKQSKDLPDYYKDLAMRMGVNPIDLANSQLKYISEEPVKEVTEKEEKYSQEQLNLLYKHPTRSRITRARIMQAYEWLKKNMPEPVTTTGPTVPEPPKRNRTTSTGERTPWKEDQPQWTGLFNWGRPNTTQTSIYNKKSLIRDDM